MGRAEILDQSGYLTLLAIEQLAQKLPQTEKVRNAFLHVSELITDLATLRVVDEYTKVAESCLNHANFSLHRDLFLNDAESASSIAVMLCSETHPIIAKAYAVHGRILVGRGMAESGMEFLEKAFEQYQEFGMVKELQELLHIVEDLLEPAPENEKVHKLRESLKAALIGKKDKAMNKTESSTDGTA